MNETSLALIVYIAWMIILLLTMISIRSYLVLSGKKSANGFSPSGDDVSAFIQRLSRVHANCYEHFPVFGGLMLLALALDLSQLTNPLAYTLIGLRLAQGVVHMISKSILFVYLRLALFLGQLGIALFWIFVMIDSYWT